MSKSDQHRRYATLLAQKLLANPQQGEMEALLGLGLDIDWFAPVLPRANLCDLAFSGIRDSLLFDRWWLDLTQQNPHLTPWSPGQSAKSDRQSAPYVLWGLLDGRWATVKSWLSQSEGTPQQWSDLASSAGALNNSLSSAYPSWRTQAQSAGVPAAVLEKWDTHRRENMWLYADSQRDFEQTAPSKLSPEQLLTWAVRTADLCRPSSVKTRDMWRLEKILKNRPAWSSWSKEQWSTFWQAQPAGTWTYYASSVFRGAGHWMAHAAPLHRSTQWSPDMSPVVWNDINEILTIKKSSNAFDGEPGRTALSGWLTWLKKGISELAQHNSSVVKPEELAAWMTIVEHLAKPATFSSSAVAQWSAIADMPVDPDTFRQWQTKARTVLRPGASIEGWQSPEIQAVQWVHMFKSKDNQPDVQAAMVDQLEFLSGKGPSAVPQTTATKWAVALLPWLVKGAQEAPSPASAAQWSHAFWRCIPHATTMQHYWLKKSLPIKSMHVPLRFWDDTWEAAFSSILKSKKKTKEINAVLSNMLLLQATKDAVKDDATSPKRKM